MDGSEQAYVLSRQLPMSSAGVGKATANPTRAAMGAPWQTIRMNIVLTTSGMWWLDNTMRWITSADKSSRKPCRLPKRMGCFSARLVGIHQLDPTPIVLPMLGIGTAAFVLPSHRCKPDQTLCSQGKGG